jgi:hypothetical protein
VPETASISRRQLEHSAGITGPVAPAPAAFPVPDDLRVVRDAGGARLFRGDKPLTPAYAEIESFDVSGERGEVVFSARRDSNFDIGLVSTDGSQVNWIPEDPADEISPKWASRGHKAAFIVRHSRGDLIRTVHIPTAVQLLVSFPSARIGDFVWDRAAEKLAVAWETAESAPRVEVMRYGGEERRTAIAPAVVLPVSSAPFGGGLMLSPTPIGYDERIPLVMWLAPGERNLWDDARAALMQSSRVAVLIVESAPDAALMEAIRGTRWIDTSRLYLVSPAVAAPALDGVTIIAADAALPAAKYSREGSLIRVHPAVIKSFAARLIADQLKGSDSK